MFSPLEGAAACVARLPRPGPSALANRGPPRVAGQHAGVQRPQPGLAGADEADAQVRVRARTGGRAGSDQAAQRAAGSALGRCSRAGRAYTAPSVRAPSRAAMAGESLIDARCSATI